jgi:hypothetical protein
MTVLEHLDLIAEDKARTLAGDHTRRGFLGRMGKVAVALTGVGAVELALTPTASAHHFCGHTGTSPTCSGNPWPGCNGSQVRGGCWTACCTACCQSTYCFKRSICDCCTPTSCSTCSGCSRSQGYCPGGYCVKCVHYRCTGTLC